MAEEEPARASAGGTTGPPDPAFIERLRQSGISLDREGHFVHEGEPVLHEGLRRALFRWLDRLPPPDGRHVLRLDERRFAYVTVEDTPLVVRGARLDEGGRHVSLTLSDEAEEWLEPASLRLRDDGSLVCGVRGGKLEARFSTAALAALQGALFEEQGVPYLQLGGRRVPLRSR